MNSGQSRWIPPSLDNIQSAARVLSRELISIMADFDGSIDLVLKNKIYLLTNYLNQYGTWQIWSIGSSDVENMDTVGKKAFEIAKDVVLTFDKSN
jgi:hypothetical protein